MEAPEALIGQSVPAAELAPAAEVGRLPARRGLAALGRNIPSVVGALVVLCLGVVALFPAWFASADPYELNAERRLLPPSTANWLGTDEVGRDLYARIVYGSRVSLRAGLTVVLIAAGVGTLLGGAAGYWGRALDEVIMRVVDILISFPPLIMAMALVAALGPSLDHAALALSVIWWPQYARLMRGQVLSVSKVAFVEAAVAAGVAPWRLLWRHIFPNCWGPLAVKCTLDVGYVILLLAALSFIGLGAKPPTPEWGALITTGRQYLLDYWWYPTFPGFAIFLVVMGFNLMGDGLRDVLDPQE